MGLFVGHALGDCILVGTGEGAEYQIARVRLSRVDVHSGQALISLADPGHIREVEFRIDAVRKEVHRHCDKVHIAGSLAVSKQRAFHAVRAGKDTQLCVRDTASAVIVGVEAEYNAVSIFHMLIQILNLGGKHVRHGRLDRRRNVDDGLPVGRRLPYVQHGVADFERILYLCPVEALRAVFKHEVAVGLLRQLLEELCAVDRELLDLLFVLTKATEVEL